MHKIGITKSTFRNIYFKMSFNIQQFITQAFMLIFTPEVGILAIRKCSLLVLIPHQTSMEETK